MTWTGHASQIGLGKITCIPIVRGAEMFYRTSTIEYLFGGSIAAATD